MNIVLKIVLTILAALYILSPYDVLPDFIPVLGRGDDLFILAALFYYVWRIYRPQFIQRFLSGLFSQAGPNPIENDNEDSDDSEEDTDRGDRVGKDPFEILGLSRGATPEEIKSAYRRESQRYHPDKVAHLGVGGIRGRLQGGSRDGAGDIAGQISV